MNAFTPVGHSGNVAWPKFFVSAWLTEADARDQRIVSMSKQFAVDFRGAGDNRLIQNTDSLR
ncbi:MAG: hypothetical protein KDB00_22045, partial [Planctomycetales bacterium]|nr:hypothetical protein [Planctomycetales bacterium]